MLRTIVTALFGLGLTAVLPVAAFAQDTTCRNGLFADGEGFREAEVTAQRAFFYEDADGCPTSGECRTRSYVIDGDVLVIDGRRTGDFACAFFPNEGGGTAGWLKLDTLHIRPLAAAPPLDAWLGDWSDGMSADVTIGAKYGRPSIAGQAFWPARPEDNDWISIHTGEVLGGLAIQGHRATYADDNLCELELTLLDRFLLVSDNRKCGGANVTFSGVYQRTE